jgi:ribosome maturation factor RimP
MSQASSLAKSVADVIEPLVQSEGYDLVDLEFHGGKRAVLQVYIDRTSGTEPVGISDCVRITKLLEPALDAADLIATAYTLEVSSPGVERPLRRPRDFVRCRGKDARVTVREDGVTRSMVGRILDADDESFEMDCSGEIFRFEYTQVEKANLEFIFGAIQPAAKAGPKSPKAGPKSPKAGPKSPKVAPRKSPAPQE